MRAKYRLSAAESASVTVFLVKAYDEEKDKTTTRARLSQQTLRVISARKRLHPGFIDDWIEELAGLGWSVFPIGDHFAIIRTETTESWVRIGSKRIRERLRLIQSGDSAAMIEIEDAIDDQAEEADED